MAEKQDVEYAEVEVEREEILVHPGVEKSYGDWMGLVWIGGTVVLNGVKYKFDRYVEVEFERE